MAQPTLEERLRRIEDRQALEDLVCRYAIAVDDQDWTAMAEILAAEAVLEKDPPIVGRDRVIASMRESRARMGLALHTPDYLLLTFDDDDHATGTAGAHIEVTMGGELVVGAMRYRDQYLRESGEWRIRCRSQEYFYVAPWTALGESLLSDLRIRWPGRAATMAHLGGLTTP
jgi:hypothetical protein